MRSSIAGIGITLILAGCSTALECREEWHGEWSNIQKPFGAIVSTEANWKEVKRRMFDGVKSGPERTVIDFERDLVLVLSEGDYGASGGITPEGIWDEGDRILVRVRHLNNLWYSADGSHFEAVTTPSKSRLKRPYGLIVLPRGEGKPIIVEYDRQPYRDAPPMWKERYRLVRALDPNQELDAVPK